MGLFNHRKDDEEYIFETTDILIVFDNDKKTSDIKTVTQVTEDSVIVAGFYKVPLEDCEITTGKEGRNFFYRAPSQSVLETGRLAQLEMNMVLEQITAYKPPMLPTSMDWTKGLMFGAIFLLIIGLIFK